MVVLLSQSRLRMEIISQPPKYPTLYGLILACVASGSSPVMSLPVAASWAPLFLNLCHLDHAVKRALSWGTGDLGSDPHPATAFLWTPGLVPPPLRVPSLWLERVWVCCKLCFGRIGWVLGEQPSLLCLGSGSRWARDGPQAHRRGLWGWAEASAIAGCSCCFPFRPLSLPSWLNLHPSAASRGKQEGRAGEPVPFSFSLSLSLFVIVLSCFGLQYLCLTPPSLFGAPPSILEWLSLPEAPPECSWCGGEIGARWGREVKLWEMKCCLALAWQKEATAVAVKSIGFGIIQT